MARSFRTGRQKKQPKKPKNQASAAAGPAPAPAAEENGPQSSGQAAVQVQPVEPQVEPMDTGSESSKPDDLPTSSGQQQPAVPVVHHRPPPSTTSMVTEEDEAGEEVVEEFPVILLRPPEGQTVDRLLFNHPQPAKLENCTARYKQQVRHLEINYSNPSGPDSASVFDGTYFGESTSAPHQTQMHACGFFREGKLFLLPVDNTYQMQRRMASAHQLSDVDKAKIDDAKLAELEEQPQAFAVRPRFARQETEWQKKRREQSSNHRQKLIDQDPWLPLPVQPTRVQAQFAAQMRAAEQQPPLQLDPSTVPIL